MSFDNDAVHCVFKFSESVAELVCECITKFNRIVFFLLFLNKFTEEQERVQKKTFVNWINSYLSKVSTKLIRMSKWPYDGFFIGKFMQKWKYSCLDEQMT